LKERKENNMQKSAAVLTIKDASKMNKIGRMRIANWIRKQAKDLEKTGDQYSGTMRARYLYEEK